MAQPVHTVRNNYLIWGTYDWSELGREWVPSQTWKETLFESLVLPYIPNQCHALEIGAGAGEWSEALLQHVSQLTLVDIVPRCLDICKIRFEAYRNINYLVNDGQSLQGVAPQSINLVLAMNVFIQNGPDVVHSYLNAIAHVLAPNGTAVIHHARHGLNKQGWRSNVTDQLVADYCQQCGLTVLKQVNTWANGKHKLWDIDTISIIQKQPA